MCKNFKYFAFFLLLICVCVYKLSDHRNGVAATLEKTIVKNLTNHNENNFVTKKNFSFNGIQSYAAIRRNADADKNNQQTFTKIHDLIYPKAFNTINGDVNLQTGRNITLNEIALKQNGNSLFEQMDNLKMPNENWRLESDGFESKHGNADLLMNTYGQETATQSAGPPLDNYNNTNLLHLVNPLFVMGLLAFVAYLISSVLGLVDRLHLTNVLLPHDYARVTEHDFGHSLGINSKLLKDFENILQITVDLYDKQHK